MVLVVVWPLDIEVAVDGVTGIKPPRIDISVEVNAGKENVVSDLRGNGSRTSVHGGRHFYTRSRENPLLWCYKVLARFESTGNHEEIKSSGL